MTDDKYRRPTPVVETLREWDVILMHGTVRLIGMASTHTTACTGGIARGPCQCLTRPRISSRVVDKWKRPLRESSYSSEPLTGEARHLLSLDDGDEVDVFSGKTYRLEGPRKVEGYDGFASGSIFHVYAVECVLKETTPARARNELLACGSLASGGLSALKLAGFGSFIGWGAIAIPVVTTMALWVLSWCVERFYRREER